MFNQGKLISEQFSAHYRHHYPDLLLASAPRRLRYSRADVPLPGAYLSVAVTPCWCVLPPPINASTQMSQPPS